MKVVKSIFLFSILFLFTTVINYNTINYFSGSKSIYSILDNKDFDTAGQDTESEKSTEKNDDKTEVKDFDKDFISYSHPAIISAYSNRLNREHHIHYSSADYSQVIYSPPEHL